MLPGLWQVKKPELWKSLKFLGNMWMLVYFSAQAGRVESCQHAALSLCQQEGEWTECEREGGPDGGRGRWETDEGRGEEWVKQRTDQWRDRGMEGGRKWLKEWNGGWRERGRRRRGRHPLLDAKQRVGQMNVEFSVSRTGRGLETDGFTHRLEARERTGGMEGLREGGRYNSYILSNCQVQFRQTFKMSQKIK